MLQHRARGVLPGRCLASLTPPYALLACGLFSLEKPLGVLPLAAEHRSSSVPVSWFLGSFSGALFPEPVKLASPSSVHASVLRGRLSEGCWWQGWTNRPALSLTLWWRDSAHWGLPQLVSLGWDRVSFSALLAPPGAGWFAL